MTLLVSLGLAAPYLPDGKVSIYNCHDDDDCEKILAVSKSPRVRKPSQKKGGLKCYQIRHENALKRYGEAFAKFGGVATKTELASVIPNMTMETIYQYLIRHQGDTTKIIGKRGREFVWEWIYGNE